MVSFLSDIIDPQDHSFAQLKDWIDARLATIAAADPSPDMIASFVPIELTQTVTSDFGTEASPEWRRFFLATLLADWACYDAPVDRVDFARLKYIMTSSSQYFRLWCATLADGTMMPVGYSAWYPIAKFVYDGVMAAHEEIDDRGAFMPLRFIAPEDARYGYAFNISVIKQLRNTVCSRRIIRAYQRDSARLNHVGGFAVTVDVPGRKMSRMSGLDHHGDITVQGSTEGLFVRK